MPEIITVIAQISALTFLLTSMLAMDLSLTVKQIMNPLRNTRLVLLALLPNSILAPPLKRRRSQVMVMLVAILGLIQLMVVGGEMGKRVQAAAQDEI